MEKQLSLCLLTDDTNVDLWPGFLKLAFKYWPESKNIPFIVSSRLTKETFGYSNVFHIKENEYGWGKRFQEALRLVATKYVIVFLDDFFIKKPVDNKEIEYCIDKMNKDKNIVCFNFAVGESVNKRKSDKFYSEANHFSPYKVNTQICIWRTGFLKKIIRKYENPWEFEICGTFRSYFSFKKFYFVSNKDMPRVFYYDYGFLIIRGMLNKELGDFYKMHENINLFSTREILSVNNDKRKRKNKFILFFKCLKSLFVR